MLRNRNFILLWLVNALTTLAIELFTVTVLVAIFEQTSSTVQAVGVMVSRTLPAFLLGPLAGVLVDRFPRKHVLISMDVVRLALIGLSIWLLSINDQIPVLTIYLLMAAIAAAGVLHRPARLALIPSLVGQAEIVRANSLILVSNQVMLAISYTVGGWLILYLPLRQIIVGVSALIVGSILAAALLKVPPLLSDRPVRQLHFFQTVLDGWRYLRRHPIARPLTVMEAAEHVPHGIWTSALMLAFTFQVLGGDAADWGYQSTGYFAGMTLGSLGALFISNWLSRYPGYIIILNALIAGLLTLAYAVSPSVAFAVVLAVVFGLPGAVRDVAQDSLLQATVADEQLGRVYATREMLRNVVIMVAGVFFAWLSEQISVRWIYVIGGVAYMLTAVYAMSNQALRQSKMGAGVINTEEERAA
ncbi:MAG: MFS transporter [Ardenticatenales bacterium]|nr:MFS transporter [Ardenticatenales bacterium]